VAIQYSISYDEKGSPSLVKNTIEGPKQVIKTSFNIGKFEPKRTISDFANVSSFDDIVAERDTVNKSLQNFIYKNNTNSDGDKNEDQQKSYSQQDFEAKAARDATGKVIGGLTFKERMQMTAYQFSELPEIVKSPFGIIGRIFSAYGKRQLDDYYNPNDPMYDYTGEGADLAEGDISKPGMGYEAAYGSKFSRTTAIAEASELGFDPNSVANLNLKLIEKEFINMQNLTNKALHGDNDNTGSISNEQAAANREGRRGGQYNGGGNGDHDGGASAGAQSDAAAGMGGY